jgi:hypothetical protein
VYGQLSLTAGTANPNGVAATSLSSPIDVAVVGSAVYIVDEQNQRVLY